MIDKILRLGEKAVYLNGTTVFEKGKPANTVFYITNGLVQLNKDENSLMVYARKGVFLGLAEALSHKSYTTDAYVFTYAEVFEIDAEKLITLSNEDARVQNFIIKKISQLPMLHSRPFE